MTNTEARPVAALRSSRRTVLHGLGAIAAGLLPVSDVTAADACHSRTFVLIHGAWHGGWCWAPVVEFLRAWGHRVYAPTLTGCGERVHLLSPETDLRTHVTDVMAMLHYEDLSDVVLVGHSYAGLVITQLASEAADHLHSLIYLDAFLPEPGQSFQDIIGQDLSAVAQGGSVAPMLTVDELGISDKRLQAFVEHRLTPHPLGALQQKAEFDNQRVSTIPRAFIQSSDLFSAEAEKAARLGFHVASLGNAGHNAMLTQPDQLARLVQGIADRHERCE